MSKIECFTIESHQFSPISEMTLTLITDFNNIAYQKYLKQLKRMLEWKLNEKLA